ncbi:MAG: CsiV family protein [Pseudomonadota bacterium]
MARGRKLTTAIAAVVCALLSVSAYAELPERDYWRWFEVEVLLFKQTQQQSVSEQFPLQVNAIESLRGRDLLSSYFAPNLRALRNALQPCQPWSSATDWQFTLSCRYPHENPLIPIPGSPFETPPALNRLQQAAVVVNGTGGNIAHARRPFLMPASSHVLTETRTTLQRKNLAEPLLHLAWRQPVFNEDDQQRLRLFGGRQFSDSFRYDGFERVTEQHDGSAENPPADIMDRVQSLLNRVENDKLVFQTENNNAPGPLSDHQQVPERVWQLDGLLHIFLVGNYLHIEHDFNLREAVSIAAPAKSLAQQAEQALSTDRQTEPFLRAYRFNQRRRVISHETHYFDHPKVGMVIQIRRTKLSPRRF